MSFSFLIKFLGLDKIVKEALGEFSEESWELILPLVTQKVDSMEILREISSTLGLDLKVEEGGEVDEVRRLASLASNVIPLKVKDPEKLLWEIAQAIKPKGNGK